MPWISYVISFVISIIFALIYHFSCHIIFHHEAYINSCYCIIYYVVSHAIQFLYHMTVCQTILLNACMLRHFTHVTSQIASYITIASYVTRHVILTCNVNICYAIVYITFICHYVDSYINNHKC